MRCEFCEAYNTLFMGLYERLKNSHKIKMFAIQHCKENLDNKNDESNDGAKFGAFSPLRLKADFKMQPLDLRQIDGGNSIFLTSDDDSFATDSESESQDDNDDMNPNLKNSIETIQERDSEYDKDNSPYKDKISPTQPPPKNPINKSNQKQKIK